MEKILQIPFIGDLFELLAVIICIVALIKLIKHAIEDYKSQGLRGILDEVLLTLCILAILGIIFFSDDGLATIFKLIEIVINWIINGVLQIVEQIFG